MFLHGIKQNKYEKNETKGNELKPRIVKAKYWCLDKSFPQF